VEPPIVELSDEFWERVRTGSAENEEILRAAQSLRESCDAPGQSRLIYALGQAGAIEQQTLIESFLSPSYDLATVWAALTVLVTDWGQSSPRINDTVRHLVEGADWDESAFMRELAVSLAGSIARNTGDLDMISTLLRLARGEIEVRPSVRDMRESILDPEFWEMERHTLHDLAIDSLAYVLGYSHQEIVGSRREAGEEREAWERTILAKASDFR